MATRLEPGDTAYLEYWTGVRHTVSRREGYTVCGEPLTDRSRRTTVAVDPMCRVCELRGGWRVAQPVGRASAAAVARTSGEG